MASDRTPRSRSMRVSRGQASATATGVTRPIAIERRPGAQQVDRHGGEKRAGGDGDRDQALQDAVDAGQHLIRDHPPRSRERGDVDDRVAHADHGEGRQRDELVGKRAQEGERHAPQDDPHAEPARHRPAPDEPRGGDRAGQRPDAHRALQPAHPRLSEMQQVDRDHHDEDGERAPDGGLQRHEPHDQRDVRVIARRAQPVEHLRDKTRARRCAGRRRALVAQPEEQGGRSQRRAAREGEHRPDVGHADQERRRRTGRASR